MLRVIEGRLERELTKIILAEVPNEAAGLILPNDRVVQLTNEAATPANRFQVSRLEIQRVLVSNGLALSLGTLEQMTIWHSHPGGGVGPSRIDLAQRVAPMSHLVLAVTSDGLIPTWY